jgi:hypothetical protein
MYEVIWSTWNDAYIVRAVCTYSSIKPEFIGTHDECAIYIVKNTAR